MQFDAVETGVLGARGGVGEQAGQDARQFGDMRQVGVGDTLAMTELQAFQFARREHAREIVVGKRQQSRADRLVVGEVQCGAMRIGDGEEAGDELVLRRAAADRQEIDDLDE
jgi:hypothetical protein